jgi:murein DD-endopeptidase MepM/ murein hydrolase activator NlpD
MAVSHHIAVALACALLAGTSAEGFAQKRPQQSSKLAAFGSDPNPSPAESKAAPEPVTPARALRVAYGVVVPAAPRVVAERRNGRLRQPASFTAQAASATRFAVNSGYGFRTDPLTGAARMHTGVDLAANYGETVGASMSGRVAFAGVRGGYGNLVVVDHGLGIATYYAHLSAVSVVAGEEVAAGQVVGYVGTTGRSTGPHLHYEVRANGYPLNPATNIAVVGDHLYVYGRHLTPRAPDEAPALPPAPGGTTIGLDWSAASGVMTDAKGGKISVDLE